MDPGASHKLSEPVFPDPPNKGESSACLELVRGLKTSKALPHSRGSPAGSSWPLCSCVTGTSLGATRHQAGSGTLPLHPPRPTPPLNTHTDERKRKPQSVSGVPRQGRNMCRTSTQCNKSNCGIPSGARAQPPAAAALNQRLAWSLNCCCCRQAGLGPLASSAGHSRWASPPWEP